MNCVKNDIARVVGIHPAVGESQDRVVRVVEECVFNGEPAWVLEERVNFVATGNFRSMGRNFYIGEPVFFDRLQDKYLRPIRGNVADDEVRRLYEIPKQHEGLGFPARQLLRGAEVLTRQSDPCRLDDIEHG